MPTSALGFIGAVRPKVLEIATEVLAAVESATPERIDTIWGLNPASVPEHSSGLALDFMCTTAAGDWIADHLWTDRARLGLRWEIWRQRIRSTSPGHPGTWVDMEDRGSVTANHFDHVHCFFWDGAYVAPGHAVAPIMGAAFDGHTFPGAAAFRLGQSHPAVTVLGQRLIVHGFGRHYLAGPGPVFTEADRLNCQEFQTAKALEAAEADGFPRLHTWTALMAVPTVATPLPVRPKVSLALLQQSEQLNVPAPQGSAAHRDNTLIVEKAMAMEGVLEMQFVDGSFGSKSVDAYRIIQRRAGSSPEFCDGNPGLLDLSWLGHKYGFDVVP